MRYCSMSLEIAALLFVAGLFSVIALLPSFDGKWNDTHWDDQ
jgi:hypothetical protein